MYYTMAMDITTYRNDKVKTAITNSVEDQGGSCDDVGVPTLIACIGQCVSYDHISLQEGIEFLQYLDETNEDFEFEKAEKEQGEYGLEVTIWYKFQGERYGMEYDGMAPAWFM